MVRAQHDFPSFGGQPCPTPANLLQRIGELLELLLRLGLKQEEEMKSSKSTFILVGVEVSSIAQRAFRNFEYSCGGVRATVNS